MGDQPLLTLQLIGKFSVLNFKILVIDLNFVKVLLDSLEVLRGAQELLGLLFLG